MSSWRKPMSLTDALHQLDGTASVHRLYNALVVIRTNYSKGNETVTALRHHGGDCYAYSMICYNLWMLICWIFKVTRMSNFLIFVCTTAVTRNSAITKRPCYALRQLKSAAQLYEQSKSQLKACNKWMTFKVTQGHQNCIWYSICHFLLVVSSNNDSVSHCFQDITAQCTWLAVTSRSSSFSKIQLKLQAMCAFWFKCRHILDNTYCISGGMGIERVQTVNVTFMVI